MGLLGSLVNFGFGMIAGHKQDKAAKKAAQLQYDAAMKGIAESARQFDQTQTNFQPYMQFGQQGIAHYGDLAGLNGDDAQTAEITSLRNSPLYQMLYHNGEQATLANAAATGGLRGGNTEHALYNVGEDTLAQIIQQQLGTYGNAIGVGQGAVGSVGAFGANAVNAQALLRNQGADAQAQQKLIHGGIAAQNWMNAGKVANDAISALLPGGFGSLGSLGGGGGGLDTSFAKAF